MDIGLFAGGVNKVVVSLTQSFKQMLYLFLIMLICRFPLVRPMRFCHICFCLVRLWVGFVGANLEKKSICQKDEGIFSIFAGKIITLL